MSHHPMDALLDALSRGEDAQQAASAAGLDAPSYQQLLLLTRVLEARERRRAKRARLVWGGVVTVALATGVLFTAGPALAQAGCAQTLPAPLVTFCPDTPAQAAQVNGNFQQLVTWVQQKVGPVGNGNISTGSVTATGNLSTSAAVSATGDVTAGGRLVGTRAQLTNGVIQRGGTPITGTSDLGLYSRSAGEWLRFVTNGGAMRFSNAEGPSGTGATADFSIEPDGTLTNTRGEPEGTHLLPRSFCVVVPVSATCPANWDQREVRWDTEDENNTDSGKDNVIATGGGSHLSMRFCCRAW